MPKILDITAWRFQRQLKIKRVLKMPVKYFLFTLFLKLKYLLAVAEYDLFYWLAKGKTHCPFNIPAKEILKVCLRDK